VSGSRLFSRPKAKFKLKNVEKFLHDNFSPEEIRSGRLNFQGKDIFLLQEGDDAAFLSADAGQESALKLAELLFLCIVDVSETPEFAFGTAVQSSKASVSEQLLPLARKIRRKRGQFEEPYGQLAAMFLTMWAKVENRSLSTTRVQIGWDEVAPRNDAEIAQTIKTLVEGLVMGIEAGLISLDAAAEFLREYVPSMFPWIDPDGDDDERRRVARTMALLRRLDEVQPTAEPEADAGETGDSEREAPAAASAPSAAQR
jgi:hypothetical protein